jgi:hypothetical protein
MSKFADFHDISARFDTLIRDNALTKLNVPLSKKHHIAMSITRIGLFRTGGIEVNLVSISKFGALFSSKHHSLHKPHCQNMVVELSLNGKCFEFEAHIVQQDNINNFYGIKFEQPFEAIEDYLLEFHLHPYYNDDMLQMGSVWLHLAQA